MQIQLYIEGAGHEAAAAEILQELPSARMEPSSAETKGIDPASLLTLFKLVTAGAAAIGAVAGAGYSVAKLAKFLLDWKREKAEREKTILRKTTADGEEETLVLKPLTELEELERFLKK